MKNQNEIETALGFIHQIEPDIRSKSYEYIRDKINELFKLDVSTKDIEINMSPTLEEEIEDLKLIHRHDLQVY